MGLISRSDDMLTLFAYAKINLILEVLSKREDGYHRISSILQTISISDELSFEPCPDIVFCSNNADAQDNPFIKASALQTASLLQKESGCHKGAIIGLVSASIPHAAGLGSSSSLPATILKGLNNIWALNLSDDQLRIIASKLGSDTPFFISGGTALAEGRGEQITRIKATPMEWLVLITPPIEPVPDKTAKMYKSLNVNNFTSGDLTTALVSKLELGHSWESTRLYNAFEEVAYNYYPFLDSYRLSFMECGAERVHLAGSGPALFTFVSDQRAGEAITARLRQKGFSPLLAHTV